MKKYTYLDVALINDKNQYSDGRVFPFHMLTSNNGISAKRLRESDIWHVHNYWTQILRDAKKSQKIIAQFHSIPRLGNWRELIQQSDKQYTIQQPLQEREYKLPALPNIIDPDEYRPAARDKKIKIAFAPTTRLRYGHPSSKAYYHVRSVLTEVGLKKDIDILWIEGLPYKENLKRKSQAHILIDDIATGNWHRTSLEGACFGCAVLNRVKKHPFVYASLKNLKEKLIWLIEHPRTLQDIQHWTRLWALQEWHAMDRIQEYIKAYSEVLNCT